MTIYTLMVISRKSSLPYYLDNTLNLGIMQFYQIEANDFNFKSQYSQGIQKQPHTKFKRIKHNSNCGKNDGKRVFQRRYNF